MRIKIDNNLNCDIDLKMSKTKSIIVKALQKDLIVEMNQVEFNYAQNTKHKFISIVQIPNENFIYSFDPELDEPIESVEKKIEELIKSSEEPQEVIEIKKPRRSRKNNIPGEVEVTQITE